VIDDTVALFEMFGPRASGDPYSKVEPGVEHLAPELRRQYEQPPGEAARVAISSAMIKKDVELLGVLHAAGIPIVAGTDQAVPGYSVYREVELYVQAGFTPMEALQAATLVPARVMKVEADTGTVQPGKRADFDILDRNPLDDIHNIRSVHWVVANGVLYDPAPLWKSAGFQP
jgi:hypothetical protein